MTWPAVSWLVPLAFVALPGCDQVFTLHAPPPPEDFAIFCDIEDRNRFPQGPARCAEPEDLMPGAAIPLANAAVALTTRATSSIGLDYSPNADTDRGLDCAPGVPVAISFQGAFPKGTPRCRKAPTWSENLFNDANAECRAECREVFASDPTDPAAFCQQHARASTNYPIAFESPSPYDGACTDGGMEDADNDEDPAFDDGITGHDPRRIPQHAPWEYVSPGVEVMGSTLIRQVPTTGFWDAGAATRHVITEGNGYVEFTIIGTDSDRACGLSSGDPSDVDTDPNIDDIDFAIRVAPSSGLIIHESGAPVTPFMPYAHGDRARVKFIDNLDGTAQITYHLIPPSCPFPVCEGVLLHTAASPASYPLRLDASLLTHVATLGDVRLVHVKKPLF